MNANKILVYLGATTPDDTSYTQAAQELGEGLAKRGLTLVYGGSKEGTMTILADAVLNNGGQVIGVSTEALAKNYLYPGLTQTIVAKDLAERKNTMYELADVIIALPGSFGTWDELFDALARIKIAKMHKHTVKPVALLNLNGFYDGILAQLQRSIEVGYTKPRYAKLLYSAHSVNELLDWLGKLNSIN